MGLIDGKVAILTGSGRGIGGAAARLFAAEGASVVVSDLDPAPAEETATVIRKAGITGLTKTLAKEWGRYNVQVNCVCYGFIDTRLTAAKEQAETLERDGEKVALGVPDAMRQMAPMLIPLGRPGTPEEAAGPMLFLASPLSDYVSGHVLEVTGGRAV